MARIWLQYHRQKGRTKKVVGGERGVSASVNGIDVHYRELHLKQMNGLLTCHACMDAYIHNHTWLTRAYVLLRANISLYSTQTTWHSYMYVWRKK